MFAIVTRATSKNIITYLMKPIKEAIYTLLLCKLICVTGGTFWFDSTLKCSQTLSHQCQASRLLCIVHFSKSLEILSVILRVTGPLCLSLSLPVLPHALCRTITVPFFLIVHCHSLKLGKHSI